MNLLAQTPDASWFTPLSQVASIGFSIWYGWYVTTRAIPRIIDKHSEQMIAAEEKHEATINNLTASFRDELRLAREAHDRDRDKFLCRAT